MSDHKHITEEELNQKYDPQKPDFDREAYKAELIELHKYIMEQLEEANLSQQESQRKSYSAINIYSEDFDPDEYINTRITLVKGFDTFSELVEKLAQLNLITTDTIDEEDYQTDEKQNRSYDTAIEQGAITTIGNHVAFPSAKAYEDIFTHVLILPKEGTVLENGEVQVLGEEELKNAEAVNIANLAALFQMITVQPDSQRISLYLPTVFQREMGIDPRKFSSLRKANGGTIKEQRFNAFVKWFKPLEDYMLPLNGKYYRACMLEGYDPESETVTLYLPFFFKLADELREATNRYLVLNRYFHADIVNEKNVLAIEVAAHLTNKLLQEGTTPKPGKDRVTYHKMYKSIIRDCEPLKNAMDRITTTKDAVSGKTISKTQAYNAKLKQVFETAYRLILEKSDFPKMFVDFRINGVSEWEDPSSQKKRKANPKSGNRRIASKAFKIPTKSTLNQVLYITHKGRIKNTVTDGYDPFIEQ